VGDEQGKSPESPPSSVGELRQLARRFIGAAFDALSAEHVLPTPVFHPYLAVGRDYFGDTIRALEEYRILERQLDETYPDRFAEPLKRRHAEFASSYIFSFLEACIARCAHEGEFSAAAQGVDESIDELLAVLETATNEIVCCRHVSHLTTTTGAEVEIGEVTVVPEPQAWEQLVSRVQWEVRGAARAWNRDDPRPYDPPHSLLITREISDDPEPYEVADRLSRRLEQSLVSGSGFHCDPAAVVSDRRTGADRRGGPDRRKIDLGPPVEMEDRRSGSDRRQHERRQRAPRIALSA
jgi:hypothetical protein